MSLDRHGAARREPTLAVLASGALRQVAAGRVSSLSCLRPTVRSSLWVLGKSLWRPGVLGRRAVVPGMSVRNRWATAAVVMDGVQVVSWRFLLYREKRGF